METKMIIKVTRGNGYLGLAAGRTGRVVSGAPVVGEKMTVTFRSGSVLGFKVTAMSGKTIYLASTTARVSIEAEVFA